MPITFLLQSWHNFKCVSRRNSSRTGIDSDPLQGRLATKQVLGRSPEKVVLHSLSFFEGMNHRGEGRATSWVLLQKSLARVGERIKKGHRIEIELVSFAFATRRRVSFWNLDFPAFGDGKYTGGLSRDHESRTFETVNVRGKGINDLRSGIGPRS